MNKKLTISVLFIASRVSGCFSTEVPKRTQRPIKNIIIMITDGCGYNHIDAASLYQ